MKALFILAFIFCSFCSNGQAYVLPVSKDSLPEKDTITCVFLISDTIVVYEDAWSGSRIIKTPLPGSFEVQWCKGYMARERHWSGEGQKFPGDCSGCYSLYMKEVTPLDNDKKIFRKGIIIWQVK